MSALALRAVPRPRLLGIYFAVLIVLLYLPIAVLLLFSFNAGTSLSFPLQGLTTASGTSACSIPRKFCARRATACS